MEIKTLNCEKDKYFRNGELIQKIFDAARKNFDFNDSVFGNYASNTMMIIECDSNEVDMVLDKIKEFYNDENADFYDMYLTLYKKTINEKINDALIEKEIEIINPDKILYMKLHFDHPTCVLSKDDSQICTSKDSDKFSYFYKKKKAYDTLDGNL